MKRLCGRSVSALQPGYSEAARPNLSSPVRRDEAADGSRRSIINGGALKPCADSLARFKARFLGLTCLLLALASCTTLKSRSHYLDAMRAEQTGDFQTADKLLAKAAAADRHYCAAVNARGWLALARGDYQQAAELLASISPAASAGAGCPRDAVVGSAILGLVWTRYELADHDAVLALVQSRRWRGTDRWDSLRLAAWSSLMTDELRPAEQLFQQLLRHDPVDVDGLLGLARVNLRLQRYEAALSLLHKRLRWMPEITNDDRELLTWTEAQLELQETSRSSLQNQTPQEPAPAAD